MQRLNVKIERIARWQTIGIVGSESIKQEWNAHAMQVVIALRQIGCINVRLNVVCGIGCEPLWFAKY